MSEKLQATRRFTCINGYGLSFRRAYSKHRLSACFPGHSHFEKGASLACSISTGPGTKALYPCSSSRRMALEKGAKSLSLSGLDPCWN